MSWAAHDLEPYVIQKHMGRKVAFMPLLAGSYAPDMFTKWFVYGVGISGTRSRRAIPRRFHRGWPGFGFTHSLIFGASALAGHLRRLAKADDRLQLPDRAMGPRTDRHRRHRRDDAVLPVHDAPVLVGAWAYAGQLGRQIDAGAYYSGLGFVWDWIWLVWADGQLAGADARVLPPQVMVARSVLQVGGRGRSRRRRCSSCYRAAFFYGAASWIAWSIWAHVVHPFPLDLRWGGPHWVHAIHSSDAERGRCLPVPVCRATQPTLFAYGIVIACVRHARGCGSGGSSPARG